jgi:hypothetical protein
MSDLQSSTLTLSAYACNASSVTRSGANGPTLDTLIAAPAEAFSCVINQNSQLPYTWRSCFPVLKSKEYECVHLYLQEKQPYAFLSKCRQDPSGDQSVTGEQGKNDLVFLSLQSMTG